MLSGLVKRHESLKKYIKTILDQLPPSIEKYPSEERKLLMEFLSIVAHYEEADFKREELGNKLEIYRQEIVSRKNYIKLPFSWFVETYFRNARVLLSISKFHAKDFYEYLVKHFRGNVQIQGAFKLIRETVSLKDLAWEKLQYECTKLLIPLTTSQIQILKVVYSQIEKTGIYTLDPYRLKDEIIQQLQMPSSAKTTTELKRIFTLLEARWYIRFFSPAFGLDRLFFHIQLINSSSFQDLIDCQDPLNSVLGTSDIYRIRDKTNTYMGVLYIPSQDVDLLISYIKRLEKERTIVLHDLQKIKTRWLSISLNQYEPDLGWIDPTKTEMKHLARTLNSEKLEKRKKNLNSLYIPPSFNFKWHFSKHPLPRKLIELYCKIPQAYSFSDLPLGSYTNQKSRSLEKADIGLLKQLYYNRVIQIDFIPFRVVYDYSYDLYYVNIPRHEGFQLKQLLQLLPYGEIIETKRNIKIWTRLSQGIIDWMQNDLTWEVEPMIRDQFPRDLDQNWFNKEELQWITPKILLK